MQIMRKISILLLLSVFAMSATAGGGSISISDIGEAPAITRNQATAGKPEITFRAFEHDFGKIKESGKKVSYDYVFTNTGDCPLVITRVVTSCRCVSISYTKRPVPPGGQGMVTVTYDPKKQNGVFYKAIQVFSNVPEEMTIVIAKGEVIP